MKYNIQTLSVLAPNVQALIKYHIEESLLICSPETAYVLDPLELGASDITLYGAVDKGDQTLMAIGALREMSLKTAEVKSMRTHPDFLERGIGKTLLRHLITVCRQRNYSTLYLETGTDPYFIPAIALYKTHGFQRTDAFGEYTPDPANQFMKLDLG